MKKRAFTIIEVIVVMGIIAVLSVVTLAAMSTSRNSSAVDSAAEGLLSQIRDVQNKAVAITKDKGGNDTKVWTIEIDSATGKYKYLSYYLDSGVMTAYPEKGPFDFGSYPASVKFFDETGSQIVNGGKLYLSYSTPFGKPYITLNKQCFTDTDCGGAKWQQNANYPKDWQLKSAIVNSNWISQENNANKKIKIDVSYGGMTRSIYLNSGGDAYLQ